MAENDGKRPLKATELARVFPDHPLREERLEFEFEGFARTLAELAWNPDNKTPFTVVVRGGWGRGKTTLLQRTQWMLENPGKLDEAPPDGVRRVRTLWFNAWKYPDDDTVLAGLLGAAIDRLAESDKKLDQLKKLVASYKSDFLKALFAAATPAPLRKLVELDDRYQPIHEKRAFHDTFRKLFNEVSRLQFDFTPAFRDTGGLAEEHLWSPDKQKREVLAVFLDDLDRCRHQRVVEVLEAINLFLDLPGVCFFLGIDRERLIELLPESVRHQGGEYLEKVVQVAFDLPEVSPTGVEDYVAGLLQGTDLAGVLGGDEDDPRADVRVLSRALDTLHPRHVKRFLNDLSMTLAVLRNTGKLGDGEERLPEPAVVAWHLLAEVLPERVGELRRRPQNLRRFLVDMERAEAADSAGGEAAAAGAGDAEELPDEWGRLRAGGLPDRHLKALHGLSDRQHHLLIYMATPPAPAEATGRRKRGRLNLLDLDSPAWVEIPDGTFWRGAQSEAEDKPGYDPEAIARESPVHRVTVSSFRLSRFPVTNAQYAAFVGDTGKEAPGHWREGEIPDGKEDHPVAQVSWQDAVAFCRWLSERLPEDGASEVRLPTEAEWEFAACGEEGRRFPWGDADPDPDLANYGSNVGDTTPVGSYPEGATPEGVEDLAGNVWEWCQDRSGRYRDEDQTDPVGPEAGSSRVLRGGSSIDVPRLLRAAFRLGRLPVLRLESVGFRLCCSSSGGLGS